MQSTEEQKEITKVEVWSSVALKNLEASESKISKGLFLEILRISSFPDLLCVKLTWFRSRCDLKFYEFWGVLKVLLLALFCSENINELLTHIDA